MNDPYDSRGRGSGAWRTDVLNAQEQAVAADAARNAAYHRRAEAVSRARRQGASVDDIAGVLRIKRSAVELILTKAAKLAAGAERKQAERGGGS